MSIDGPKHADPGAPVIVGPTFERIDGKNVVYRPKTVEDFDKLKSYTDAHLKALGLMEWEKDHWLFPHEWYDCIPEGYPVVDINGKTEAFKKGVTDDDKRFGLLAYGLKR